MEPIRCNDPSALTAPVEQNGQDAGDSVPVLWLSMAHPGGRMAGSSTYSAGLLAAAAAVGADITLLTYGIGAALPGVAVQTVEPANRPRWQSLASGLPGSAWALAGPEVASALQRLLAVRNSAAIVVDHAAMGWALPYIVRAGLPLVYISHNHEGSVRPRVANAASPAWKRPLLRWDAAKFARLETALVEAAAVISAITGDDAELYSSQKPAGRILTLTPGYRRLKSPPAPLTASTPRQVMLLGRYDWVAKQDNLTRWAAEGAPVLAAAGVDTCVIGHVPEALQARLAQPGIRFLGEQPDLAASLPQGRLGLVAEALGGGFKMKTLDYIFHGLPIAALPGGLTGLPAGVTKHALEAASPKTLAEAILAVIDDLPRLARMQQGALAAAHEVFDWESRGKLLISAIKEARLRRGVRSR